MATHPDIIVMDLELPVLSGFDAARELRDSPETSHVPLIAATGYSHFNGLDHARLDVFDLVVVKPCDPAQLLLQISRLMRPPDHADDGRSVADTAPTGCDGTWAVGCSEWVIETLAAHRGVGHEACSGRRRPRRELFRGCFSSLQRVLRC